MDQSQLFGHTLWRTFRVELWGAELLFPEPASGFWNTLTIGNVQLFPERANIGSNVYFVDVGSLTTGIA